MYPCFEITYYATGIQNKWFLVNDGGGGGGEGKDKHLLKWGNIGEIVFWMSYNIGVN